MLRRRERRTRRRITTRRWSPHTGVLRSVHLSSLISEDLRQAIDAEAEKRQVTASKLVFDILTEALMPPEEVE